MAIDDADGGEAGTGGPVVDAVETEPESEAEETEPEPEAEETEAKEEVTRAVGEYDWEDFKAEYYYDGNGDAPEGSEF
jgi:hypothetical protein